VQVESGKVCTCECVFAGVRAILRVHGVYRFVYTCICIYICVCICVYMCIYIYLHVYVCTFIYTYTHPHIHIHCVSRHVMGFDGISNVETLCRRVMGFIILKPDI